MKKKITLLFMFALCVVLLSSCSADAKPENAPTPTAEPTPIPTEKPIPELDFDVDEYLDKEYEINFRGSVDNPIIYIEVDNDNGYYILTMDDVVYYSSYNGIIISNEDTNKNIENLIIEEYSVYGELKGKCEYHNVMLYTNSAKDQENFESEAKQVEYLFAIDYWYNEDINIDLMLSEIALMKDIKVIEFPSSYYIDHMDVFHEMPYLIGLEIYTTIENIPELTQLRELHLFNYDSNIKDFSSLRKMENIRDLEIKSSGLKDLSDICNFSSLDTLVLSGCEDLVDISALSKMKNLKSLQIQNCENIQIVNVEECEQLENLEIVMDSEDLGFISKCRNLKSLSIIGECKDISTISNLKKLERLSLDGNFEDVTGLWGLTNLKELYLDLSLETDIEQIKNLSCLVKLDIELTSNIKSYAPIGYLKNLKELSLLGDRYNSSYYDESLAFLENLDHLESLELCAFDVDASPIYSLSNLKKLNIIGYFKESIFKGLENLEELVIENYAMRNFDDLKCLHNLKSLSITYGIEITDMSGIRYLTNLEYLYIKDINIDRITDLGNLDKLKIIELSCCDIYIPENLDGIADAKNLERLCVWGDGEDISFGFVLDMDKLKFLEVSCVNITDRDEWIDEFEGIFIEK
ncbi:MAG: hypothetical protein AB1Z23_01965 [Eubacteriales bacterium]